MELFQQTQVNIKFLCLHSQLLRRNRTGCSLVQHDPRWFGVGITSDGFSLKQLQLINTR